MLQTQQSCSQSTQTFHPCRLSEQESSPFLHPAESSYQNHPLYATAHCCNRETEGGYKDREILNFFQAITRLLCILLWDSAESKVDNRTSQRNERHRVFSIYCFNALAACTCSFSSFLQELCTEQDTGTRICLSLLCFSFPRRNNSSVVLALCVKLWVCSSN